MTRDTGAWVAVYAVIRYDHYLGDDASSETKVTVKEILPSREDAEREVERLNALDDGHGSIYFWQYAKYFPEGRDVSGDG